MLTALGTLMHAEWYVTPDARATAVRARHAMRSDTSSFNHITVEKMQELLPNKGCPRRYAMDTANLHFNIERKQNGISQMMACVFPIPIVRIWRIPSQLRTNF